MDQNDIANHSVSESDKSLNISDVINAIRDTDPCAGGIFNSGSQQSPNTQINNDKTTTAMTSRSNHHGARAPSNSPYPNAFVKITEQPAPKALRFRYECEGRSAGSIPGASSTPDNKTYPGIQVVNYRGRAVVVVSCVTKDKPYRAHPHKLVGKDICSKGVCTLEINNETMTATFANLGIQCVKKKDIEESLKEREKIRVDPFRKGFGHASQPSSIDLNAVRLCFQVFLKDPDGHNFNIPLEPVVSEPIYDKKAMSDLVICKLSKPSCNVAGGDEIILLCEKVAKEDIQVRFFEENQGVIVWEGYGDFQHTNVHKQVAISFRTPKYKTLDIEQPVKCFIQLRRPSDNATSDALPFEYLPLDSDKVQLKRKRLRTGNDVNLFDISPHDGRWLQQQNNVNYLLLPDTAVKQEPISPNYASTSPTPPPPQRYTPSPNPLHPASVSPNIPIQGIPQQSHFDMMGGYIPSVSPLQNTNILNQQQYQTQPNQNQFNIPNTSLVNAAVNFLNNNPNQTNQTDQRNLGNILANNNLDNINQLDNNENVLDNVSGMNISSLLDLDSQQQINTNELGLSNDLLNDLLKNIGNSDTGTNQGITQMTINTIQTNTFEADEENMTDSFKQISIE
ncbi:embryonic polarity protein dorsal-like isoform X6 [Sitodiplosis mosellana]|uniref:embryonic polarity protein dorsal-like isoform X6 n=1 Tax=Sitodiplosis mosellana TaxID=263140 RepID=UPI002444CF32|nr:embryonic polarity protein dorsal-like isoform X6 [Sitodiplosis mosellana]XP_055309586.1 embryonic polarity protein dorsal-like isoform X6 [Sitodiplosis mosellana]XP_055309587.1 embryonic polarity protein dorsal-like isoform X6 [Sitodiplosis mosellana]